MSGIYSFYQYINAKIFYNSNIFSKYLCRFNSYFSMLNYDMEKENEF